MLDVKGEDGAWRSDPLDLDSRVAGDGSPRGLALASSIARIQKIDRAVQSGQTEHV